MKAEEIGAKAHYVRRAAGDGKHTCHWPGCTNVVPPAMWGCKAHWYKLPQRLRNAIWRAYVPGQEISKNPSNEYLAVAREVEQWILEHLAGNANSRCERHR